MLSFASVSRDHDIQEGREVLEMERMGERIDFKNEIRKTVALTWKEKMELSMVTLKMKLFF